MSDESRHQVNLLDFFTFIVRWRKFLLIAVLIVSVSVGIISFVLPPKYRSQGVVRATQTSGSSIGSLIASKLGSLGGIGGFAPSMGEVSGQLFIVLLKSREMSERVIEEFDLRSVYKAGDAPIEEVIDILKAHTNFEIEPQANTLSIEVDDESPERARDMSRFYMEQLDAMNSQINTVRAQKERAFMGNRLVEARDTLAMYEDSMRSFQTRTGVLDIEEQVKATVQAAAKLEAEKLITQAEYELSTQIFDPGSPEIDLLKMKLKGMDSSLATLVKSRDSDAVPDFMVRLMDSPEQGVQFLRLKREIEVQQLVVLYLTQQYEQQKVESVRNTPTLSIIQNPVAGTKRVWPQRGLMIILAAFGTFIFGSAIGLSIDFFKNASTDPSHPQHERVRKLRQSWS
jgi:tyrosine-protein kinase Etk/Wzc